MKVHHIPAVFMRDPMFVVKNGKQMLSYTLRGCTVKSLLEDERLAFECYRMIRKAERQYI